MENIEKIFYKGQIETDTIIKPVNINWLNHSIGLLNLLQSKEPRYQLTDVHKEMLRYMLQFFTGSPDFPDSLDKGLWIVGNVGSGKTILFEVFKQYTSQIIHKNGFNIFSANEIINATDIHGTEYLRQFGENVIDGKPTLKTIYIDDCFSGSDKINHYGTQKNVIEQVIEMRYNVYKKHRKLTHITTNVFPENVSELFVDADRLSSRIQEMFNKVELTSKDFRTI